MDPPKKLEKQDLKQSKCFQVTELQLRINLENIYKNTKTSSTQSDKINIV